MVMIGWLPCPLVLLLLLADLSFQDCRTPEKPSSRSKFGTLCLPAGLGQFMVGAVDTASTCVNVVVRIVWVQLQQLKEVQLAGSCS
jgi:hypothetical protein